VVPRVVSRRVLLAALSVFAVSAALGLAVDRWYAQQVLKAETDRVRSVILPYANNVAAAVGRHVSRMAALTAWVKSLRSREQLDNEFPLYAQGLKANIPEIKAVQIVRDGRIAWVYPLAGNEVALGLTLRDSPDSLARAGYWQAMASPGVTLFRPRELVQGGKALVLDERVAVAWDRKFDLVAMLVDMDAVIAAMQLHLLPRDLALEVRDAQDRLVARVGGVLPAAPDTVRAEVVGGPWVLVGGPSAGWQAATVERLIPVRVAIVAIVGLLTLLTWQIAGRNEQLTAAVEARTASLTHMVDERTATIARQEATERALGASERRLRLALAASQSATYEMDVASDRITWAPEAGPLFGLPPGLTPGALDDVLKFATESDAARVSAAYRAAQLDPSQGALDVRITGADGVTRWLTLYFLSEADDDGVVRRIVGTLTDATARKALEEQFQHAQKMQAMGALAGGIAHDFNNLLTVILGAGQMARASADAPGVPEEMRTDIDEVLAAGERASVLTGQLLAFSRRQVVQPRHFDACDLVGGMGTMLRRLVGERIRVETALPGTRVPLFADQGQITQVVMNLAVNARDAMPDGGVLRISLRIDGPPAGPALPNETLTVDRYAVLTVSDTGMGIDPAIRHLIFDPFFTTKPVGQGTGLGLATVYGIVMQLGGTLRLASEVGEGTTFDVYLPLSADVEDERPKLPAAHAPADARRRTVLLVEDEPALRHMAERILAGAGYHLIVAEDGESALAAARGHEGEIDLVVTDVVMPHMGGLELASSLLRERPSTRVLLMSGYPRGAGSGTPVTLGDAPFIAKPFRPVDLLAACRRALAEV